MSMNTEWVDKIKSLVPAGIDGNAKFFSGEMPVIEKGEGPYLYDVEGKQYIDYIAGYGPLLFGHAEPEFIQYLSEQMKNGLLYGLPHELMYQVGKKIVEMVPSAEMVRFTNTGTEATLNALRLAKGATGRDKIVKFYGNYHGTHDFVLIGTKQISSNPDFPRSEANSAGITQGVLQDVYTLQFNDSEGFKQFMSEHGEEIAAVIIEPYIGTYGIMAEQDFMEVLRQETTRYGSILIFDEIITGFRFGLGGAQEIYGVTPDLTTLGKVLGGGVPIGVFAGKRELMERIIPLSDPALDAKQSVYHSGTFNSNPLGLSASLWVLNKLSANPDIYQRVNALSDRLRHGFREVMDRRGVMGVVGGQSSVIQWYFGLETFPRQLQEISKANKGLIQKFHRELVKLGVLFIGTPRGYVSYAHSISDIDRTIEMADMALANAQK